MPADNEATEGAGEGVACRPLAVTPVAVGGSVKKVQVEAETRCVAELDWTEDGIEVVGWDGLLRVYVGLV